MKFNKLFLEDVCLKITDGAHESPKGVECGYPMHSVKDMSDYGFDYSNTKQISKEDYLKLVNNDCKPLLNDVLIAKDGSYLKNVFVQKEERDEVILSSIAILRPNMDIIYPHFLSYYLKNPQVKETLKNGFVSGSVLPRIVLKDFKKLPLLIPEKEDQYKIVSILSLLDEKIFTNKAIIKKLENISSTIYKCWFIDFEFPNEQGLPYRSSGGEMVANELGNIPHGWKIERLESIANFKNGKKIVEDKRNINGENKIYGSNGIIGFTDEVLQQTSSIIIGRVGANCGSIQTSLQPCWITDNAIICVPKDIKYYGFLYELLSRAELRAKAGGSAQPLINQTILNNITFILPNEKIIEGFHRITYKNLQMIEELKFEIEKLTQIRDALLPKLLSGEIEIPDESVVEL